MLAILGVILYGGWVSDVSVAVKEVAGVATSTVAALKAEPVLLLIILLNIAMLIATGIVGWSIVDKVASFLTAQEAYRHEERVALLHLCIPDVTPHEQQVTP